jgi:CHAT domain-containing protein
MGTLKGGLCLLLILGTTGSLPSGAPARSSGSSEWWDRASVHLQKEALLQRKAGNFRAAEKLYREGFEEAERRQDSIAAVKYLISAGGCQLGDFRYRDALKTFLHARNLALQIRDREDLGAIALNLSSVYTQVWDYESALRVAEDGLAEIGNLHGNYSRPYLLLQIGRLHALAEEHSVEDSSGVVTAQYLAEGIEAVRAAGNNVALEAAGWDWLGEEHLKHGRLDEAERAFNEAYRLRFLLVPNQLGYSYAYLGELKLRKGNLAAASRFTRLALNAGEQGLPTWPLYQLGHQLGQIRLAQGDSEAALNDLYAAMQSAAHWRIEVLPARSSLTQSNAGLEREIFRSFAIAAAQYADKTGSAAWAARAFEAVEWNRAASLRESLALRDVWRERLPGEYWEVLGRLQTLEARHALNSGLSSDQRNGELERLHLKLTEMEARAGLGIRWKKQENFRTQTSLIHFREGLSESELLLSFLLDRSESYLWAVSRRSVKLIRLPPEARLAEEVAAFQKAVRAGTPEAKQLGEALYRMLFERLDPEQWEKRDWLLSLDGVLFDLPFAALVVKQSPVRQPGGETVYLVERHSIQTVPGALALRAASWGSVSSQANALGPPPSLDEEIPLDAPARKQPSLVRTSSSRSSERVARFGAFLGVGDPIYNIADERWRSNHDGKAEGELARLAGSGVEVAASARAWAGDGRTVKLLTGADANRSAFLKALEGGPSVVHLATHVIVPPGKRERAQIAFGLSRVAGRNKTWSPQYLGTAQVSALHVSGALVVMTGCATGTGDAVAGPGLLGLTRAWLMAGASGVIATAWPVEDSDGEIFSRFYSHLQHSTPAEALRQTQAEMAHVSKWSRSPAVWATYQLTGGFH